MKQMLARPGRLLPDVIVVHTAGRPLRCPRIEVTDESETSFDVDGDLIVIEA
jgi:hypothetical protein